MAINGNISIQLPIIYGYRDNQKEAYALVHQNSTRAYGFPVTQFSLSKEHGETVYTKDGIGPTFNLVG